MHRRNEQFHALTSKIAFSPSTVVMQWQSEREGGENLDAMAACTNIREQKIAGMLFKLVTD